ncbi:MAG: D-glycero-alpha-D-manno-heptose-7-phosphate kinase [Gaiellales bacterium]|jgi:D-glycero-alpha-D-manno-heptose-7-phosphate kinase|nr:D-glycero-alpha-D-manno-heptose-7-phosphate kinase [Gaiellales bacterium]MDX6545965.1 D-glycero-alpha-D-manno-heptose-7-phosphate kinase [Gaiellales bacterium]
MNIRARAPLRISFAGGGTDVPPFPAREGGLVLNATIDRYAYGLLRPRKDRQIRIESADFGLSVNYAVDEPPIFDGRLDLVKAAIRRLGDPSSLGYDIFLHSNAPPGSGLGSSSTVMVTLIGLLKEHHKLPLTDYEVAQLSYHIERVDMAMLGGMQDQYAATFGGFNFIEFAADHVIVNPLRVSADVVNELEHNMLLCYTGATRRSDGVIEDQTARYESGEQSTLLALRTQKRLAMEMKNALVQRRPREFGDLLHQAWHHKKRMSPKITTPFIDEAYAEARRAGALGGKATGAGGGGYMLFYCEFHKKHRVAEALTRMGGVVTEFAFESEGLTTWSMSDA